MTMISEKMAEILNKHMNAEFYSSYLYLSMSAYASSKGWRGASSWLYVQAQEEMIHVQKLYVYIDDQGARVELYAIEKPPVEFGTPLELFTGVLDHERKVTGLVRDLVTAALAEADHATETFLQWFVTEQTEEEKNCRDILDRLKLAGETGPGLFMIDNELGARVLTPPAP
ncbi:Ferritin-like protein 2 [hydrothermal vent metagenome]|uniref:Ferritin-like protein 2 n=1 Tax=hydrothermal vent metagenome TaxID=652676 RepID=A0A3B0W395_9ZZZZ